MAGVRTVNRLELEHLIRASAAIAGDTHVIIIGSQSILGRYPEAPGDLGVSMEAKVYPKHAPENAIVIDDAIGERSIFHDTFGYYAHGVAPETTVLPVGWRERTVAICNASTNGFTGECLESHDLAVSKLAAGREKDLSFVRRMIALEMITPGTLGQRARSVENAGPEAQARLRSMVPLVVLSPNDQYDGF